MRAGVQWVCVPCRRVTGAIASQVYRSKFGAAAERDDFDGDPDADVQSALDAALGRR
jgi:hypothetical protein